MLACVGPVQNVRSTEVAPLPCDGEGSNLEEVLANVLSKTNLEDGGVDVTGDLIQVYLLAQILWIPKKLSFFCFQTMTRINSAGTAEPDRRGKPVAGGEWNPLPRDHGQIDSPTFLLNKHHPHCHNHPVTWIQIINNLLTIIIIVIITKIEITISQSSGDSAPPWVHTGR